MTLETGRKASEGRELVGGEKPAARKGRVQQRGGVALGEEEAVPIRPLGVRRVDPKMVEVERGDDLGSREAPSEVPAFRLVNDLEDPDPELLRRSCDICSQVVCVLVHRSHLPFGRPGSGSQVRECGLPVYQFTLRPTRVNASAGRAGSSGERAKRARR